MHFLSKTFSATALAGPGAALPAAHAAGTLNVAINQDPGSWDPIDTFVTFWGSVGSNLYDGLTMRGADLKLQPGLATKGIPGRQQAPALHAAPGRQVP